MDLASKIEHTLLKPEAQKADFERLCGEAREFGFFAVCVPPIWVEFCRKTLGGSKVKLVSVVGFPTGYQFSDVKALEAKMLADCGAHELDMVLNLSALKDDDDLGVIEDIERVKAACGSVPLKVIIETGLLSYEEKVRACEAITKAGASFVKTSTGFTETGASTSDIELIRQTVGPLMGVKASGGIKTMAQAEELIKAGATRLGCSSSVAIMKELRS